MTRTVDFEDTEYTIKEEQEEKQSSEFSPQLVFEGIELYANAILQAKIKLEELTQAGTMTPDIANRILDEYQYKFYQQFVRVIVK